MARVLPGVYMSLNDLSQFPEGSASLIVGYALKANRGPVNKAQLVTSPSDFLTKYTLGGKPSVSDDPTFWSILNVLSRTNQMYVVRAAKDPKFGGAVVKKAVSYGELTGAVAETRTLTIVGTVAPAQGTTICIADTKVIDGNYTVESVNAEDDAITVVVVEDLKADFSGNARVYRNPIQPLVESLETPEAYEIEEKTDDLMLITGIDPGAYNGELAFEIQSSVDNVDMVYRKGADLGGKVCDFDTMQLIVKIAKTNEILETLLFSRDENAKEIDGTSLSIDNVVNNKSAYIRILNNTKVDVAEMPNSTAAKVQAGAGSDGEEVNASALAAAYDVLADKTLPISIIGNGCSKEAESNVVQQKLINIADIRKDCMVFLNTRKEDEDYTLNSTKAEKIVEYKKGTLASTSFYGCMYGPHLNYTDNINSRQVAIGCDSIAIAGWLDIISGVSYPYAYAGPRYGLVSGVTCDWKIGDTSGEAELLNDASVNFVAYDGKQGRYYMQAQNTLQVANSSLRNIGCVLNILDIKEHIADALKEYINMPLSDDLRRDILTNIRGYLEPMEGGRFYNAAFQDVTTEADIAQDTLRYVLTISLTRYSQKIYCAINIVNSLFDFSILQSA